MSSELCEAKDTSSVTDNEIVPSISIHFEPNRPNEPCLDVGKAEFSPDNVIDVPSSSTNFERKRPNKTSLATGEAAESSPNKRQAVQSSTSKVKLMVKPKKNDAPCGFPQTVRSLTSTGIFDGVPVKYISTSGEELCGEIYGSGYLCGCEECKFSNVLKADEFERHAGYKTKHPNSRIYFENGKTIYGVVQKLRTTPENMLFEQISTAAGSPINQKAFSAWKDAFKTPSYTTAQILSEVEGPGDKLTPLPSYL